MSIFDTIIRIALTIEWLIEDGWADLCFHPSRINNAGGPHPKHIPHLFVIFRINQVCSRIQLSDLSHKNI